MAGTINAASLKIGLDIDEVKRNGSFTRSELTQIAQIARQSVSPLEAYERKVRLLDRALADGSINVNQYRKTHASLKDQLDKSSDSTSQQTAGFGLLNGAIGKLAGGLTLAAIAYKGFQAAHDGFNLAAKAEQVKAQFEVLTGSAQQTKQLMKDFEELDKNSPINAMQFQEAGKILLGFGMTASQITTTLDQLSEIAMGDEQKFQSLALAFGQVSANGRVMGQEVLQMINSGFNPLAEISRTTGESMASLRKRMEDGKVSFDELANAAKTATSEGGRFGGMNEKLATATFVKIAKLGTEWQMFKRSLGESVTPGINNALDGITNTIEATRSFGPWYDEFWANVTGKANKFNREREEANKSEKMLTDLLKKEQDQLEANNKLTKEKAELAAKEAADQETRWKAEQERIKKRRDDFDQKEANTFEQLKRAQMGDKGFEMNLIRQPGFAMTEAEKMRSAEMQDTMFETHRLASLRQLALETKVSKEKLDDEKKVLDFKNRGILANDEDRRKYIETERFLMFQKQDEATRLSLRVTELKRQLFDRPDLLGDAIERANRDSAERMHQIYQFGQAAFQGIVDKSRAGFAEQGRDLQEKYNPAVPFRRELDRLRQLLQQNVMDQKTFDKASIAAAMQFQNALNPNNISSSIAPALKAGTVEAYKFIAQQNEKAKELEMAKQQRERMIKIAEQQLEQNKNAPRLAMAGRN